MIREDVRRFAKRAGLLTDHNDYNLYVEVLEHFAMLVIEQERKACISAVHNALLEMGEPFGVRKIAMDAIRNREAKDDFQWTL